MNKYIKLLYVIVLATILGSCGKSPEFEVNGKITHAEGKSIYLDKLHVTGSTLVDSAKIDKNGEFKLKAETSIPAYYLLYLNNEKLITLLADSAEVINVQADEVNFGVKYSVSGSTGSEQVKELNDMLNLTKHKLDSISSLKVILRDRPNYSLLEAQLDTASSEIVENQVKYSTDFVQNNAFSMSSIFALYQKFDNNYVITDLQPLKTVAAALNSIYPESEHVKSLYANALDFVKKERMAKIQKLIDEQGTNSPDIVLPDVNGNEKALSSLQGKVVLLQFWSAADEGSRIINSTLVELYSRFKNRGFEIYQVSIDTDKDTWLNAIKEDGLTWTNVGDMEGSNKAVMVFNIQEIPFNYLLDKNGEILAKNLKGPSLYKTVAEYVNRN